MIRLEETHGGARRPSHDLLTRIVCCAALALSACGGRIGGEARRPIAEVSGVLRDRNPDPRIVEVDLDARLSTTELVPGVATNVMTYEGLFPGPLLEANVGDHVTVHFTNHLGEDTTIHWHGVRVPDSMDGSPRIQSPVPDGGSFTYHFVVPEAATFWFHPHVNTHVQVEHGLAAPFVVHDPLDPEYDRERVLMLDDVLLDDAGQIAPEFGTTGERFWGRLGRVLLTNGKPSSSYRVSARKGDVERWRMVDVANARAMRLRLVGPAHFRVIATDGGLLPAPYTTDEVLFGPGMRFDLEVSYDGPGEVRLENYAAITESDGGVSEAWRPMLSVDVADSNRVPRAIDWPAVPPLPTRTPNRTVPFTFEVAIDPDAGVQWMINGQVFPTDPFYAFDLGETVDMSVTNLTSYEHPFHLHGQFFTIHDAGTPYTMQPGLKDTVLVPPGGNLRVTSYLDNAGRWMIHCHNLEHATLGMMGEITVGDAGMPIDGGHGH